MKREPSFYVGYFKKTPADLARFNRAVVVALGLATVLGVGLLASLQQPFGSGQFDFGNVQAFEGALYQQPVPVLRMAHGYALLVGPGKHGIPDAMRQIDAEKIRFQGTLLHRDGMTMIEVTRPETVERLGAAEPRPSAETVGPVAFVGEIVDTKCFLGAMRPSQGKVHRACAIRCLSGGVPPAVLVADEWGRDAVIMLTAADGGPLKFDIEWAARPVRISGILEMDEKLPVLRVKDMELMNEPQNAHKTQKSES